MRSWQNVFPTAAATLGATSFTRPCPRFWCSITRITRASIPSRWARSCWCPGYLTVSATLSWGSSWTVQNPVSEKRVPGCSGCASPLQYPASFYSPFRRECPRRQSWSTCSWPITWRPRWSTRPSTCPTLRWMHWWHRTLTSALYSAFSEMGWRPAGRFWSTWSPCRWSGPSATTRLRGRRHLWCLGFWRWRHFWSTSWERRSG